MDDDLVRLARLESSLEAGGSAIHETPITLHVESFELPVHLPRLRDDLPDGEDDRPGCDHGDEQARDVDPRTRLTKLLDERTVPTMLHAGLSSRS